MSKWTYLLIRRVAVQVAEAWCYGWGQEMKKVYGVSVMKTLIYRDEKKTELWADTKNYKKYVKGLYGLLEDDTFLKSFHSTAQNKIEEIYSHIRKILSIDLGGISDDKLLHIYQDEIIPKQTQFYIRMWTVFQIGEPLTDTLSKKLREVLKNEDEVTQCLIQLAEPLKYNDVINMRRDLLKTAVKKKKLSPEKLAECLKELTKKYRHIPMYDIDHDAYTVEFLSQELKSIEKPDKELAGIEDDLKQRRNKHQNLLDKLKPEKGLKLLIDFIKDNAYLRDYRDSIRQKLNIELKRFYSELAKRMGITLKDITNLTNGEIIDHFGNNKAFPKDELERRRKNFLLIVSGKKVKITSGTKAINNAQAEIGSGDYGKIKEIKGATGSRGKARGIAKIINTNLDLGNVKTGDILVAGMTRQDFVPAMRKAAAIVTDEGGITCHAAIVARELNTPCVIGTKIATRALKDGDMVEVDADKGIIKKI